MGHFISHAAPLDDGFRPEVRVETGIGIIQELDGSGKAVQVKIKGTRPELQKLVNGWLPVSEQVFELAQEAKANGTEIEYRIETVRKNGKDPRVPIDILRGVPADEHGQPKQGEKANMDTARENTVKKFVGLNGNLTSEALTHPSEDPAGERPGQVTDEVLAQMRNGNQQGQGGQQVAQQAGGNAGGPSVTAQQAVAGLAAARAAGEDPAVISAAKALAYAVGAPANVIDTAGVTEPDQSGPARNPGRAVAKEEPPYKMYNSDGRPNAGSYAVQAVMSVMDFTHRALSEVAEAAYQAAQEAAEAATEAGEAAPEVPELAQPTEDQVLSLGWVIMGLVDDVQERGTGIWDRNANSHTRARSLVYTAIRERHPIPFGSTNEERQEWATQVVQECTARFVAILPRVGERAPSLAAPAQQQQTQQGQAPAQQQQAQQGQAPQQAQQGQAPQQAPQQQGQAPQQAPQQQGQWSPPTPGQPGHEAASPEDLGKFRDLAIAAGFQATPDSPISAYIREVFGVSKVSDAHGPLLRQMLDAFAGENGPQAFQNEVNGRVGAPAA